jgi:sugar phosphate isomerase/epimerase
MVREIAGLVKNKEIKVISLHNFCPIPEGIKRCAALPDYYAMSSLDEQERQTAIKYAKRTISTAASLNAKAVVLHTGRVEIADHTKELIKLYEKRPKDPRQYNSLKNEMIRERKRRSSPYFSNTLKSLDKLIRYAERLKIRLGIENRFYYREIPSFEEISTILERFQSGSVYYWHDTGHAQVMENLGFTSQKALLDAYGSRLLGMHLHNVHGCKDHAPPSKGDIDFRSFRPYVTEKTIKVIEAHYPAKAQDLTKSRLLLEKIFDGKK